MKVTTYCINKGRPSQYFGLKSFDGNVLSSAPNNWKTEQGAIRWAKNHGYELVSSKTAETEAKPQIKPKYITKYVSGVIIKGKTYYEEIGKNLAPSLSAKSRIFSSKSAAQKNAERIASNYARTARVKPIVTAIRGVEA